jgi:hypothetical protein
LTQNSFAEDVLLQEGNKYASETEENTYKSVVPNKVNDKEELSSGHGEALTESSSAAVNVNKKQSQNFIIQEGNQSESDFNSNKVEF